MQARIPSVDAVWQALGSFRIADVVDIAVVAALLWVGIVWLRTARARAALAGLAILAAIYIAAQWFGLQLTAWILQAFVAASVVVIAVVFQDDIRRYFEQLALLGVPVLAGSRAGALDEVDTVVRVLARLAGERRGALVVLPGEEPLDLHLDGGVPLDARLSEPLLLSLFDPHSPGHDGAILIHADRVERFAVHLPLSTDHLQLGQRGTRHAAALGLAERCDALCLVVSEERGTVSVAEGGRLEALERPELAEVRIRQFLARRSGEAERSAGWRGLLGRWREAAVAVGIATGVWVAVIPGATEVEVVQSLPVRVLDLPAEWEIETIDPPMFQVTLPRPPPRPAAARRQRRRGARERGLRRAGPAHVQRRAAAGLGTAGNPGGRGRARLGEALAPTTTREPGGGLVSVGSARSAGNGSCATEADRRRGRQHLAGAHSRGDGNPAMISGAVAGFIDGTPRHATPAGGGHVERGIGSDPRR